jgi:hypothetical protein
METLKVSIGQFLIEAAALTTIAALIALIISAALIRLLGSLRTVIDPPQRNGPNQPERNASLISASLKNGK